MPPKANVDEIARQLQTKIDNIVKKMTDPAAKEAEVDLVLKIKDTEYSIEEKEEEVVKNVSYIGSVLEDSPVLP